MPAQVSVPDVSGVPPFLGGGGGEREAVLLVGRGSEEVRFWGWRDGPVFEFPLLWQGTGV